MSDYRLSRRSVLRGLGVTMALPWLESMPVWGDAPSGSSRATSRRCGWRCSFAGNGFHSPEWWAQGEGHGLEAGQGAPAARRFREKVLFIRGLYNEEAGKGGHSQRADRQPALGLRPLAAAGRDPVRGQHGPGRRPAARPETKVPSLVLGCEPSIAAIHKKLLDDLQLAHLVELADHADAAGALPGPGVRPPVPRRGGEGR